MIKKKEFIATTISTLASTLVSIIILLNKLDNSSLILD